MKILLTFLLLTMSLTIFGQQMQIEPNDSKELTKWQSVNYSDIKYNLNITLNKDAPLMNGAIEISVTLTDEGTKRDLILDWRTTQFQSDKDRPFANVQKVNDTFFLLGAIEPKNGQLAIPKNNLKPGENTIRIQFASQIKTSENAITRYIDKKDGAEYIYAQFSANKNTPFPVFDQPDLKARFTLRLIAPFDWKAISNTRGQTTDKLIEDYREVSKTKTEVTLENQRFGEVLFPETKPIGTYVFAFAAGEFAEFEDIADIGLVKTAPIGSTKIYEPLRNPNAAKVYVRRSQAEKFRKYELDFFRQNRQKNKSAKLDIILLPGSFNTQTDHDGIKFVPESSVFR